jgi:hypothetical protein
MFAPRLLVSPGPVAGPGWSRPLSRASGLGGPADDATQRETRWQVAWNTGAAHGHGGGNRDTKNSGVRDQRQSGLLREHGQQEGGVSDGRGQRAVRVHAGPVSGVAGTDRPGNQASSRPRSGPTRGGRSLLSLASVRDVAHAPESERHSAGPGYEARSAVGSSRIMGNWREVLDSYLAKSGQYSTSRVASTDAKEERLMGADGGGQDVRRPVMNAGGPAPRAPVPRGAVRGLVRAARSSQARRSDAASLVTGHPRALFCHSLLRLVMYKRGVSFG